MEALRELLEAHGYLLLFAVGILEYGGVPVASVPLLILAGAFAAEGTLSLPAAVVSAALGGLVMDSLWYGLGRGHGERVLQFACALATEPGVCILGVRDRMARMGARALVVGKLLPGVANLTAPAAGLAQIATGRFLLGDFTGLLLWASIGTGLGWLFSGQVESLVRWLSAYAGAVAIGAVSLVVLAAVARVIKLRRHRAMHPPGV